MTHEDIIAAGVAGLAAAYRDARTDPLAVFDIYARRVAESANTLNAFTDLRLAPARAEAQASAARWTAGAPLSALDGAVIGVKGNIAVAGLPCHAAIAAYRDAVAQADAPVVARLKSAGAIIIGLTHLQEGALGATTQSPSFGRTENPWRIGFTPGGSSGGSGAATAACLVAAALGSDTMGSVRIPSAYCGCAGLKPSPGRIPTQGVLALSTSLDHVGLHARSVTDLAVMAPALMADFEGVSEIPRLDALRIGVWDGARAVDVAPVVADGFTAACNRLAAAGAQLVPQTPPGYQIGKDRRAGLLIAEREAAAIHADMLADNPEGFSETFRAMLAWGAGREAAEYDAALERCADLRSKADGVFQNLDVIIAPTAPQTAFSFDDPAPANQADFTAWANLAGLPAVALPTGVSPDGLPLSLQIVGPSGADARILAVAEAFERVLGRLNLPPTPIASEIAARVSP